TEGYSDFNFYIPANRIREFSWNLFAAHYVEMVKPRAYRAGFSPSEQEAAWFTLHTCLKTILLLLSPITPFITDRLWRELYSNESIHRQSFPAARWSTQPSNLTSTLVEFNSKVWKLKKARGLSLKDPVSIS
ncbi:MAG: class I tRNA ligase family protein, partial [Nitrososphaerota archaeon]